MDKESCKQVPELMTAAVVDGFLEGQSAFLIVLDQAKGNSGALKGVMQVSGHGLQFVEATGSSDPCQQES